MNEYKTRLALRWSICQLAAMLYMSVGTVSKEIKNKDKNQLIDYFCKMKELYLKQENSRIINMLFTKELCEECLEFDD